MNHKKRVLLGMIVLLAVQMACYAPGQGGGGAPQVSSPDQTLTAIFSGPAVTILTPTLPPVVTSTSPVEQPGATTAAGEPNPTATQAVPTAAPAATATKAPAPTATKAAQPTATKVVQPTATIPGVRPRAGVQAKFLSTPPTIDGDWSEWKSITTEYPANSVVWGKENWTGEDDLSSSFHIGWDNSFLYVAVKVRDDTYVQNATGANLFKGDSLELLLDTKLQDDYYYTQLSPDDFQLGISPGRPDPDGTKEAYLWFPANIAGPRSGVKIASRLEEGVYRVEAAIPWNVFELTPSSGAHYGFALTVSDNDDPNENLQQSMVSNDASRKLADPTTWGDLQLVK